MRNFFDLSTTATRFRFIAVLEALTWLGLIVAMGFKWLPDPQNDGAVRIPGMVHGAVFMIYLLVTVVTAMKLKWNVVTTLIALAASIPPFGTVVFEVWAARTGKLGELSTSQPTPAKTAELA